jgi:hypothetical protein
MAFHSVGVYELLLHIHGCLEDYLGAVGVGEYRVAAFSVRTLVLQSLCVRALTAQGVPPSGDDPLADLFAGLPEVTVSAGLALIRAVVSDEGSGQVDRVVGYVRALERDLGFAEPPASVRRPEGLFPGLRLARQLIPMNLTSGYPLALPSSWLPPDEPAPEG